MKEGLKQGERERDRQRDRYPYLELWVEREKILLQIGWQVAVGGENYIQNREELPETKSSKARGKIGVDTKKHNNRK